MAKIFDFSTGKLRRSDDSDSEQQTTQEQAPDPKALSQASEVQRKKSNAAIDRETYLLWIFSKDVDELLAKYILEFRLSPRELAAILSHRLGSLVSTTEDPEKLEEFCQAVLKRMASIDSSEAKEHASLVTPQGEDKDSAAAHPTAALDTARAGEKDPDQGDRGA